MSTYCIQQQLYLPACCTQATILKEQDTKVVAWVVAAHITVSETDIYRQAHIKTRIRTQRWFKGIHDNQVLQTSGDLLAAVNTHTHTHTHTLTPEELKGRVFFFWQHVRMFDAQWNCLTLLDLSQVLSQTVCVCECGKIMGEKKVGYMWFSEKNNCYPHVLHFFYLISLTGYQTL